MVLPTCNSRLRATATQRASLSLHDFDKAKNKKVLERLVQLLVAEACFNLDLEYLKNRLEVTDGGFSTEQAFQLVDIRNYRYLDLTGIQIYMEQYFKTMLHPGNLGLDPNSLQGTGLHLDTRPKFYRAIMRRLGVDMTHKINFKEFARILKPSQPSNVLRAFGQNLDQNKVSSIYNMERELAKSIRDAEKGFYPLGPLLTFKHTKVRVKGGQSNAKLSAENNPIGDLRAGGLQSGARSH